MHKFIFIRGKYLKGKLDCLPERSPLLRVLKIRENNCEGENLKSMFDRRLYQLNSIVAVVVAVIKANPHREASHQNISTRFLCRYEKRCQENKSSIFNLFSLQLLMYQLEKHRSQPLKICLLENSFHESRSVFASLKNIATCTRRISP